MTTAAAAEKDAWDSLPWQKKVIRGQECIVPEFGLGRVMDFGTEGGTGGYDYISVRAYADLRQEARRYTPEAVSLIDPSGLILLPYKAKESTPAKKYGAKGTQRGSKPAPVQSHAFPGFRSRKRGLTK